MDTPYNFGGISGYNYNSLMNDPYFLMALNSYNPNFKSSQTSAVQQAAQTQAETGNISQTSIDAAKSVNYAKVQPDTSNTGLWVTGAIGAAALIGLGAKGHGNPIKGTKTLFEKIFKSSTSGSSETINTVLKNLTAVKEPDGTIRFMIPNKTTTLSGSAINRFASKHGVQEAVSSERQAFNAGKSKIDTFVFSSGAEKYVVKAENGVITAVKDKTGSDILKRMQDAETGHADALRLEGLQNILKELGKTKDVDKSVLNGVTNIRYTNTYGDDVLQLTLKNYGDTPQLRKFTTLQRFDFNDNEMQALKLASNEKIFANSKFFKDGKLVDGVQVSRFSDSIGGGNIGNFEGQKLVSITKADGTVLPADSAGYESIKNKYKKDIDKLVNKIFVKRDYIPNGAVIVAA